MRVKLLKEMAIERVRALCASMGVLKRSSYFSVAVSVGCVLVCEDLFLCVHVAHSKRACVRCECSALCVL